MKIQINIRPNGPTKIEIDKSTKETQIFDCKINIEEVSERELEIFNRVILSLQTIMENCEEGTNKYK